MPETIRKFEFRKAFPLIALVGLGALSLFAIKPAKVRERLKSNYRNIFDNLLANSNEKEEVDMIVENLPEGSEPALAQWMNDAMEANSRKIAKGQVKPHHVLVNVLESALSLAGRSQRKTK